MRPYVVEVIFDSGWKIEFEGTRFGPYPRRDEAVTTASTWVENGRKQGHHVLLVIQENAARPSSGDAPFLRRQGSR